MKKVVLLTAALLITGAGFSVTNAQSLSDYEASGISFSRFVRPGEASIQIWVISDNRSGIYEIGDGINLGELIVLTGTGPGIMTTRERRRTTIRVFRETGASRNLIYESSLEDMVREPSLYPDLNNGDVIMLETRVKQRFQWRDALSVISAASTTILLVDRIRRM